MQSFTYPLRNLAWRSRTSTLPCRQLRSLSHVASIPHCDTRHHDKLCWLSQCVHNEWNILDGNSPSPPNSRGLQSSMLSSACGVPMPTSSGRSQLPRVYKQPDLGDNYPVLLAMTTVERHWEPSQDSDITELAAVSVSVNHF